MGKVKVKSISERDPGQPIGPILLRFEHASVKPHVGVDLNRVFATGVFETDMAAVASKKDYSYLNRSVYENRKLEETRANSNKKKNLVALQSDSMTYLGTKGFDNPSIPSSDDLMRTYVALKEKNKLRIFEVTPVIVSPYFKGHSFVEEDVKDTAEKTKEEKRAIGIDLVKTFGSKRKRLIFERQDRNQINMEDMQGSIDDAVGKLEVVESEPITMDDSILTLIPPCNRDATVATEVYILEDILSKVEQNEMEELVDQFGAATAADLTKWQKNKIHSDYFVTMWAKLKSQLNTPKGRRLAKIVLYTELLIVFLKLRHEQIRKKKVDLPKTYPMWIREKVMDNFTVMNATGIRNRPDACKDKACCYVMVLVLLANDLHFDVPLMSTSINVHINKILTLARAVGMTVNYNAVAKEHKAYLKVPLPKQIDTRGRRRGINSR